MTVQQISSKAASNDALRRCVPLVERPDRLMVTRGIAALDAETVASILERVRGFDEFTQDNDPWGQHDFGSFVHGGRKVFWKIDDYTATGETDEEGLPLRLVLTVMLASEY